MANQIKTKFIGNDQVVSEKILLENDSALRAKDSGDATQDLLKIDGTDKVMAYRSTGAEEIAYMSDVNSGGTALQDHIDDTADAHDASAISVSAISNLAATDVQAALAELQGDIDGIDGAYVNTSGDTMTGNLNVDDGLYISTLSAFGLATTGALSIQSAGDLTISAPYTNMGGSILRKDSLTDGSLAFGAGGIAVDIQGGNLPINMDTTGDITLNDVTVNSSGVYSPNGLKKINTDASGVSFGASDSMTLSGSASSILMDGNITMSPTTSVTINGDVELNGDLDLNANAINGLVTPSSNGQPLIFDQLGAASGVAPLNSSTKIDSIYLPSYVDDVEEYANLAAFPVSGEASKIYVALDSNKTFRWSGSTYVEVSPSEVNSVNGEFGVVTLDSSHIAENDPENRWYTTARESAMEAYADQAEVDAKAYADGIVATEETARENEDLTFLKLDGTRPMEGSLDMSSHSITLANSVNETGEISSFGFSMENNDVGGDLIANSSYGFDSINVYKEVTSTSAQVFSLAYVSGKLSLTESAGAPMVATQPEHVIVKAALDAEVTAIDGRLDTLEAVSPEIFKKTLIAGDITNEYVDLSHEAIQTNDFHVFADRLALHQGATEDYSLSVVSGVTRITFLNDMIGSGNQKLTAGDTIYVRYKRSV